MGKVVLARKVSFREALLGVGFLMSSFATAGTLVACDNGGSGTSGTGGEPASVGARVYAMYCNSCHPGGGRGAGPALIPLLPGLSDDQIRNVVRHAKAPMPRYNEHVIPDDQLTSLILYMRTLK